MSESTLTTLRQIALLVSIPAQPRTITVTQLQEKLQNEHANYRITKRSLQRNLQELALVFPLEFEERGRTFHWFWTNRGAFTQLPAMSDSTAFVLCLADEFLRPVIPHATLSLLDPYFTHAHEILDGTRLGRFSDRVALIESGFTLTPPSISYDVHDAVYEALMTNRKLEVQYRSKHSPESRLLILNPLGLVVRSRINYLVATADEYDDIRHFVLHRMSNVRVIIEQINAPEGFSLSKYLEDSASFDYPESDEKYILRALFDAGAGAHLTESTLSEDHRTTEQSDGRILVEATVADTSQLRWWLLGFGSQVEVLEPISLREELRDHARRSTEIYG